MTDIQLRALEPADAAAYMALRREMLAADPISFGASPETDVSARLDSVIERLSQAPGDVIFGAFDGEQLVASVGLFRPKHAKTQHNYGIWGVYVRATHRGLGLGRRLMMTGIEHARSTPGIRQIFLSVSAETSAARSLYESLGFSVWGVEPGALQVDGRLLDEVHMQLVLE